MIKIKKGNIKIEVTENIPELYDVTDLMSCH